MAKVGLVFGGRSVEHEVSVRSARTVAAGLRGAGHEVVPLGVAPDGCWLPRGVSQALLDGDGAAFPPLGEPVAGTLRQLVASGVEVVFPIVHGTWGEDGALQGLCEMLDLPYVGAGVTASAVAMDKLLAKRQLEAAGVPVVPYAAVERGAFERSSEVALRGARHFAPPVFVKPSVGGSSVGVGKVKRPEELAAAVAHALRFDDRAVVERGIVGRELECSVLGYRTLEASAVVGEVVPGREFYDYADKYLEEGARLLAPAALPEAVRERLRRLAVEAFAAVGGWGMARVDFLLEGEDGLYVNEINTLPGFTAISMYPQLWEKSGLPLAALCDRLIQIALERHADRRRLDRGIKEWIAELAARHGG